MTHQNPQRVVILGASGFIGINLAHALVSRGMLPVLFSRHPSLYWPENCPIILGDLASPPPELLDALQGAWIFHLVNTTRPSGSTVGAMHEAMDNIAATISLLESTIGVDCRWIFASSGGTVYGQPVTEAIDEDHPTNPISTYGVAKLAIEKYFQVYRNIHGIDHVVARISNPYGPFQVATTGQGLIATLFDRITRGAAVEIWGDGENVRDYIYIDDVIDALMNVAGRGKPGRVYNIGSGIGTSINALVPSISSRVGVTAKLNYGPARGIDVRSNVLDITRICQELAWFPQYNLDIGLDLTKSWISNSRSHPATS